MMLIINFPMMNKYYNRFLQILSVLVFMFFLSCHNEDISNEGNEPPQIKTLDVYGIAIDSAVSGGKIVQTSSSPLVAIGICWDTLSCPTITNNKTIENTSIQSFSSCMKNLISNTTYYVRSYAVNKYGIGYGEEKKFTTLKRPLELHIESIVSQTPTSYSFIVNSQLNPDHIIQEFGICISQQASPDINDEKIQGKGKITSYESQTYNLSSNTTYYVRAYAITDMGIIYSNIEKFTTSRKSLLISTNEVISCTDSSAICLCSATNYQEYKIISYGVFLSTQGETLEEEKEFKSSDPLNNFKVNLQNLTEETSYSVRGYVRTDKDTIYGNSIIFKTLKRITLPVIELFNTTNITESSAMGYFNIFNPDECSIITCGICISTNPVPTLTDHKFEVNPIDLNKGIMLCGLESNTTYYARAYLKTDIKTIYGSIVHFTTNLKINIPSLQSYAPYDITDSKVSVKGKVINNGGAPITEYGFCWNTHGTPEINDQKNIAYPSSDIFTAEIINLSPNTSYYIRAYAKNEKGVGYGSIFSFTTQKKITLPNLTTTNISYNSYQQILTGGEISSDGGAEVLEKGVCWSTSPNPTINNNKQAAGNGSGKFKVIITDDHLNSLFYVRAYATNSAGTAYGNQVTFISGYFSDIDGNIYGSVKIGDQIWMANNLRVTRYQNGDRISNVSNHSWVTVKETGAYCNPQFEQQINTYGRLYNWYACTDWRNICPEGWHVPTSTEWRQLCTTLGGTSLAGKKLKSNDKNAWDNFGGHPGTNETQFSAIGVGYLSPNGQYEKENYEGHWWSQSQGRINFSYYGVGSVMYYNSDRVTVDNYNKNIGKNVRCIKD